LSWLLRLIANFNLLIAFPHGCATTTIDSGADPVATNEIMAEFTLAEVMLALNAVTVLAPLLAT
jgi:hypothetical protein